MMKYSLSGKHAFPKQLPCTTSLQYCEESFQFIYKFSLVLLLTGFLAIQCLKCSLTGTIVRRSCCCAQEHMIWNDVMKCW